MADTTPKTGATPGNPPFIFFHTKAPWTAERGCIYAENIVLAEVYSGATDTILEARANARLMAASPELLARLVALVAATLDGEPALLALAVRQAVAVLAHVEGSAA